MRKARIKIKANDSTSGVKSILNRYFDGKTVRSLRNDENLPKGFQFKSKTNNHGIVRFQGIDYDYFIIDGKLQVIDSSTMKSKFNNNTSEVFDHYKSHKKANDSYNECAICGEEIQGKGHNGEPVVKGRVCDECNERHVLSERTKAEDVNKYVLEYIGDDDFDRPLYVDKATGKKFCDIDLEEPYSDRAAIYTITPDWGEPDMPVNQERYEFAQHENDSMKGQDSADIQTSIMISHFLANKLVDKAKMGEGTNVNLVFEGKEFRISYVLDLTDVATDFMYEDEFDEKMENHEDTGFQYYEDYLDSIAKRISSGDLSDDVANEITGEEARIEIWV